MPFRDVIIDKVRHPFDMCPQISVLLLGLLVGGEEVWQLTQDVTVVQRHSYHTLDHLTIA